MLSWRQRAPPPHRRAALSNIIRIIVRHASTDRRRSRPVPLLLSAGYASRSRTDHWFVYDLYVAFLGREPDAGGWAAWEAGVPSQGRPANVYGFSSSGNGEWVSRSNSQYAAAVAAQAQGGVSWLVSDHLGTPRMVVDQSGSLSGVRRHDYLPFGEELQAGVGGRMAAQGYGQIDNLT